MSHLQPLWQNMFGHHQPVLSLKRLPRSFFKMLNHDWYSCINRFLRTQFKSPTCIQGNAILLSLKVFFVVFFGLFLPGSINQKPFLIYRLQCLLLIAAFSLIPAKFQSIRSDNCFIENRDLLGNLYCWSKCCFGRKWRPEMLL